MVALKLRVQQVLPDFWSDNRLSMAICNLRRIVAVTAASSALPMVFVMTIPFDSTKLGEKVAGWYVPAPVACSP